MRDMNRTGDHYTTATVAEMFQVDEKTVRRWAIKGQIPAWQTVSRVWLFPAEEVEKKLAEQQRLSVHSARSSGPVWRDSQNDPTVGSRGQDPGAEVARGTVAIPKGGDRPDSGGKMKIVDLLNYNPAFVRQDLNELRGRRWNEFAHEPQLRELRYSMDRDGQVLPILTTSDYLIIDGARRVCAALSLGWATINVLATSQWQTAMDHLAKTQQVTRERGLPSEPMRWLELSDLVRRILAPLYEPVRRERMVANRKKGARPRTGERNFFAEEIAEALGIPLKDLHAARDLEAAVILARKNWGPDFARVVATSIEDQEREGIGQYSVLRHVRQLASIGPEGPRALLIPQRDLKQAEAQEARIRASIAVIEAAGHTLDEITVNPAMELDVAKRLRYELQVAIRAVHRLRGRLQEHIEREDG